MDEAERQNQLELLRRAVDEVDVLQAIYGNALDDDALDDDDAASSFRVISTSPLERARLLLEGDGDADGDAAGGANIPQLEIELCIPIGVALGGGSDDDGSGATIRCRLPPRYPENAATVALICLDGLRRSYRDDIARKLNDRAAESASTGQEAILDVIDYLKELVTQYVECDAANAVGAADQQLVTDEGSSEWGRRWIWVHHITDVNRCKSIVKEARQLSLRGYLKPGYPGIVCIEGNGSQCDAFVTFIKGNKSRPGGFGRNWGHHVRGHIEPAEELLPDEEFREVDEDLAVLAKICRDYQLEDEFKDYVLQHKG